MAACERNTEEPSQGRPAHPQWGVRGMWWYAAIWVCTGLTWAQACGLSVPAACCDTPSAAPPGRLRSLCKAAVRTQLRAAGGTYPARPRTKPPLGSYPQARPCLHPSSDKNGEREELSEGSRGSAHTAQASLPFFSVIKRTKTPMVSSLVSSAR